METVAIIVAVVVVVAVLIAVAMWINSRNQSRKLAERFGPEYDRAVGSSDKRSEAERELREREARVQKLRLKDLDTSTRQRFVDEWRRAQEHFVDDPAKAVSEVDDIVEAVMDKRGYPVQSFDQQAADISVDHPEVVTNYRAAHAITIAHEKDGVSTEDLRQAMIHYRALFAELVEATPTS